MNKGSFLFTLFIVICGFNALALNVTTTGAGELSESITEKDVTELAVTGTIDVRDIKFIADELIVLKSLDLSAAQIVAYGSNLPYFDDVLEYGENMLPDYCFFDKEYETVKLPSSLKYIGEGAFGGCRALTSISVPTGLVEIGDYAFISCSALKEVIIPQSVKSIGKAAFSYCAGLNCVDLSLLESDCAIGENTFANCAALEKVILSNKIMNISSGMFAGCVALSAIKIGENSMLERIGENAFDSTALTDFAFDSCPNVKEIADWAFSNTQLKDIQLPAGVEVLGEGAFFYNTMLENILMPQNVSEVNDFLLAGAESLKKSELSYNTSKIGRYAFENNIGMTEMVVNAVVVPELGENVFDGMYQSTVVLRVPSESVALYKSADQWKEFNVMGDMSTLEESIEMGDFVNIYISEDKLFVSASEKIKEVNVYEPGGILLVSNTPCAETATIDMHDAGSNIYIVFVQLESGRHKTVKLVK